MKIQVRGHSGTRASCGNRMSRFLDFLLSRLNSTSADFQEGTRMVICIILWLILRALSLIFFINKQYCRPYCKSSEIAYGVNDPEVILDYGKLTSIRSNFFFTETRSSDLRWNDRIGKYSKYFILKGIYFLDSWLRTAHSSIAQEETYHWITPLHSRSSKNDVIKREGRGFKGEGILWTVVSGRAKSKGFSPLWPQILYKFSTKGVLRVSRMIYNADR